MGRPKKRGDKVREKQRIQIARVKKREEARARTPAKGALPFHEYQRRTNDEYYRDIGPPIAGMPITLPFETPVKDPTYIKANAEEFIAMARRKQGTIDVHEFGAANGTFAKAFMDYLAEHAHDVYERTHYRAWDKSPAWTRSWNSITEKHGAVEFDVRDVADAGSAPERGSADVVYCHELFDDLPTRIVANRNGKLQELWFTPRKTIPGVLSHETEYRELSPDVEHYKEIKRFMKQIPERVRVPINIGAANALTGISRMLKKDGVLRAFDYGHPNKKIISLSYLVAKKGGIIGPHSSMMADGYAYVGGISPGAFDTRHGHVVGAGVTGGMHITTMVNFPFLERIAKKLGMRTRVEPDSRWASRIAGSEYVRTSDLGASLAYRIQQPLHDKPGASGLPYGLDRLLVCHPLNSNRSVIREVKKIVEEKGDNEEGLKEVGRYLESKGIRVPIRQRRGSPRRGYVLRNLTSNLIDETNRVYKRIRDNAKDIDIDIEDSWIVERESQAEHMGSLNQEVRDLEQLGFGKKEVSWQLFGVPVGHRYSGGLHRVSFEMRKPLRRTRRVRKRAA